jgi:hypothetical protein
VRACAGRQHLLRQRPLAPPEARRRTPRRAEPRSSATAWTTPSALASWSSTRLQRHLHRGEARAPQEQLRRDGPLLLRLPRDRVCRQGRALGTRRVRDHRPQPHVPRGRHRSTW